MGLASMQLSQMLNRYIQNLAALLTILCRITRQKGQKTNKTLRNMKKYQLQLLQ